MPTTSTLQTVLTIFTIAATLGSALAILRSRQLQAIIDIYIKTVAALEKRIEGLEGLVDELKGQVNGGPARRRPRS